MADIELVIKLPEEQYDLILKSDIGVNSVFVSKECMMYSIKNGTPLSKGHGALKDENYLLNILRCEEYETCTWRNCSECNREKCIKERHIVNAPTIIEADKVEEQKIDNGCKKLCGK